MGIDKSMHEDSPIVIIDGMVYQYGRVEPDDDGPTQWKVEHHSYAKEYFCFPSEQDMLDFIDGLPELLNPPFEPNQEPFLGPPNKRNRRTIIDQAGWEAEQARCSQQILRWRHDLARRKRREKASAGPVPPGRACILNCRAAIDAILAMQLRPNLDGNVAEVERQISLVLQYEVRKFHEALSDMQIKRKPKRKRR